MCANGGYECGICGAEAGDTTHEGLLVRGGYGSVRYDATTLIWVTRGDAVPKPCYLCDDCVDRYLADGQLEKAWSGLDETAGLDLTARGYAELFAYGARIAYNKFWVEYGDCHYPRRAMDEELRASIVRLRETLVDDPVLSDGLSTPRIPGGQKAVEVGKAHAIAAIALGLGEEDLGFDEAAREWGNARAPLDAEADEAEGGLREAFRDQGISR